MHTLTVAVLAAVLATGWCSAQTVPRPQRFRPSFPSTSSPSSGSRHPSDDHSSTIFTSDSDQNTFPGSSSSDGFFGSGRPGITGSRPVFVGEGFRPSDQGFGVPSTSTFGTPAPTTFGSQGGFGGQPVFLTPSNVFPGQGVFGNPNTFSGQGVFGTPNSFSGQGTFGTPNTFSGQGVFGTPVTFGNALPRQGGTTFNTGLGSNGVFRGDGTSGTTGTSGRFPSNTQFGGFSPSGFGGTIPVFLSQGGVPVIFTQNGIPVQGFIQTPLSFSQTPSGGFSQSGVPFNSFGQSGVPLGFNQVPVNAIPGSVNVPTVFPPPPISTRPGGIFGSDRGRPSFDSSSSSSGSTGTSSPGFPRPNPSRRVFLSGKSGTSSSSDTSSSSSSKTNTN